MRPKEKRANFSIIFSNINGENFKTSKVNGFTRPLSYNETQKTLINGYNSSKTFLIAKKYIDKEKQLLIRQDKVYKEEKYYPTDIKYIYHIETLYRVDFIDKSFYRNNGLEYIPFICTETDGWQSEVPEEIMSEVSFYPSLSKGADTE